MFSNKKESFLFAHSAKVLLFTLAMAAMIRFLFLSAYSIQTTAMLPNLAPGEFVLGWKTFVPKRGDVVMLGCPGNEASMCVKRIIGLPGDRVEIIKQRLLINDVPADYEKLPVDGTELVLMERWETLGWPITVDAQTPVNMAPVVVPPDHVFLLNDRRSDPVDSRQWGPIPTSRLEAQAWRIWMSIDWKRNRVKWSRLLQKVD